MICEWCEIGAGEISDYADSAGAGALTFCLPMLELSLVQLAIIVFHWRNCCDAYPFRFVCVVQYLKFTCFYF